MQANYRRSNYAELPTVSIVFELLGSAIAAAAYKLLSAGASLLEVAEYINSSKALAIVSGILISVAVAFVAGALVQYVARLVFSFKFEGAYRKVGAVYGGLSITAIIYFLVMNPDFAVSKIQAG